MHDDLHSLRNLLARTERQRDEALADQLRLDAARRAAAEQAEQLVTYRREYEQRWSAEFCREGRIELVRCYQGFMQRLTQAVEQQQCAADHAVVQAERAASVVLEHEIRATALQKVIERRLRESDLAAARYEQKQSDEHAARSAWQQRRAAADRRGAL